MVVTPVMVGLENFRPDNSLNVATHNVGACVGTELPSPAVTSQFKESINKCYRLQYQTRNHTTS